MTKEEFAKKNNYHCIKRCCDRCVYYYPFSCSDRGNCLHPDRKNDPFEVCSYGTCKAIKLREGYK